MGWWQFWDIGLFGNVTNITEYVTNMQYYVLIRIWFRHHYYCTVSLYQAFNCSIWATAFSPLIHSDQDTDLLILMTRKHFQSVINIKKWTPSYQIGEVKITKSPTYLVMLSSTSLWSYTKGARSLGQGPSATDCCLWRPFLNCHVDS